MNPDALPLIPGLTSRAGRSPGRYTPKSGSPVKTARELDTRLTPREFTGILTPMRTRVVAAKQLRTGSYSPNFRLGVQPSFGLDSTTLPSKSALGSKAAELLRAKLAELPKDQHVIVAHLVTPSPKVTANESLERSPGRPNGIASKAVVVEPPSASSTALSPPARRTLAVPSMDRTQWEVFENRPGSPNGISSPWVQVVEPTRTVPPSSRLEVPGNFAHREQFERSPGKPNGVVSRWVNVIDTCSASTASTSPSSSNGASRWYGSKLASPPVSCLDIFEKSLATVNAEWSECSRSLPPCARRVSDAADGTIITLSIPDL